MHDDHPLGDRHAWFGLGLLAWTLLVSCSGHGRGLRSLASIEITPTNPQIALGTAQPLTAMGYYLNGSAVDLTDSASWSSSAPTVASVSNASGNQGLTTSSAVGSATITATVQGVRGTTTLTVTPAALVSIAVTPTNSSIASGTTQQFTAMGTYSDLSTQNLTAAASWSSLASAVATFSNAPGSEGEAASAALGSTMITATIPGVSGRATLTVTAAVLVSIAATPTNPSIALGTTQQFTAMGTFSDLSTQVLTTSATWSSSAPAVATVSNAPGSEGSAPSVATGSTTITATQSGIIGSTTLTVTAAALVSIAVTPTNPSIALGTTQQFVATGTFSDLSTQDLTAAASWSSSAPAVATVSNAPGSEGEAASVATGSTTITATQSGIIGSTTLTVTAAVLVSIAVTPTDPSIALGTTQQFVATGTYSDLSTQNLTISATWSSSAPAVATVSNAPGSEGEAASVATGNPTITATQSGIGGSTTLTVTAAVLVSIAVTPANPKIAPGATMQFVATGTYSDQSTQDLTISATWSSSAPAAATVSNASGSEGQATGVAIGSTTISASQSSVSGGTALGVVVISLRGASSASAPSSVTSLPIATPAGTVAGDVMIATVSVRPQTAVITPPAGWVLVRVVSSTTGNTSSLAVYRRVASVGEPVSHTWTFSTSTGSAGGMVAFSGVDSVNPIDVEGGQTTASGLTHTAPSVTTTIAYTMLFTAHCFTSSAVWTPPAGLTEAFDVASLPPPQGAGISMSGHYALQAAAGATGAQAAVAGNDPDTGNAVILALRPAP